MKKHETLFELLAGIILYGIIMQILLLIVLDRHVYYGIGLWCGIITVLIFAAHLEHSIEDSLDYNEEGAKKHGRKNYFIRLMISAVIIGTVLYFQLGSPITILVGVTSLKLAAYFQPKMHKLVLTLQRKKGGKDSG